MFVRDEVGAMLNLDQVATIGFNAQGCAICVTFSQRDVLFPADILSCVNEWQARRILDEIAQHMTRQTRVLDLRPLLKRYTPKDED